MASVTLYWLLNGQCKEEPEKPLYNGGILEPHLLPQSASSSPALLLHNLTTSTKYSFSCLFLILYLLPSN